SGSGKSTVLHVVAGLTPIDKGTIEVCGVNISECTEKQMLRIRRENIGFIFQDFRLLKGLTALENVMVPLFTVGKKYVEAESRSKNLLKMLELDHRMHHYSKHLSGGELQRLGIARALANSPQIILADEPTGNLDQKLAHGITKMLVSLPNKTDTSVLMVTHNQQLTQYASRCVELVDGCLKARESCIY
ncbi:MAG: ABC transporter ATP-binding protein, partial [Firmicutes bacterium]|nr:ABC transporter ATP-binding protein [Bacillota bacterium]